MAWTSPSYPIGGNAAHTQRQDNVNMTQVQLSLLGTFTLTVDGALVSRFRSQREAALLAYLAVEADHTHGRERLAGLLWPDKPEATARQNLRQTLTNLRALLQDDQRQPPLLLADRNTVQWNRNSSYTLDVETFRTALATCATHNHNDLATCRACQAQMAAAVALYQGPFLGNFAFGDSDLYEEWLLVTREQFQHQALQALSQLSAAAMAQGDWAELTRLARRQVLLDPLHEPAQRYLLQALANGGDRSGALSHFESFAAQLQRELGVAPSPETLALLEQIRTGAATVQPPQHASDSLPARRQPPSSEPGANIYKLAEVKLLEVHGIEPSPPPAELELQTANLSPSPPVTASSVHDWGGIAASRRLVGRAAEEAQLQGWLQSGVQVICLWGWAGVGKTVLAQTVARRQTEHCPVIIWRSAINAPSFGALLQDWLTVLGDPATVGVPDAMDQLLHRLFAHLHRQRTLLVVDNLDTLLQRGPAGRFRPEHEVYAHFLQRFAQDNHQGVLLLTCREQPELLARLEEETPTVRSLALAGLSQADSQQLLAASGLPLPATEGTKLIERFTGNPALLKFAATSIQDLFGGDVNAFFAEEALMYGLIRDLYEQYRVRMTYIEGAILSWLGMACEPISLARLRTLLVPPLAPEMVEAAARYSTNGVVEAIHSLQRRGLIEQTPTGFTTFAVVIQNMTSNMLELLTHEVLTGTPGPALYEFALVDAQASPTRRQKQFDGLVRPLLARLAPHFHQAGLVTRLEEMITAARQTPLATRNYLLENLVTLLDEIRPHLATETPVGTAMPELPPNDHLAPANQPQAVADVPAIPTFLPEQLTPLIGRERELAELIERLHQPNVRLLTLVGAGGMGKTTLALAVAQAILDSGFGISDLAQASPLNPKSKIQNRQYRDGIFFVALEPLSSTAALPSAIATALGLTLQGSDLGQALIQPLRHKQLLLILDNVEHLLHEANGANRGHGSGISFISELLQATAGVQILATSRERLNLRGEHLYPVQPLAFTEQATLAEAAAAPAVQLFVQSVQRSNAGFTLTTEELPFVLRICRLVQGMPLGLELAAANVDLLPLAEIAREIEQSVEFLAVDWHDLPERQRSMRAVFAWSWQLLDAPEQHTLRQLAIFRGGFTREAAQQIVGAGLPALTGLMRKSLLQRVETEGGERFQIHEVLRQFAAEQLTAEPQVEQEVHRQHATYYLSWLAAQDADMVSPRSPVALQAIETELGNINTAWLWAVDVRAVGLLNAVLISLHHFYSLKGRAPEGTALFAQAATRLGEQPLDEAHTLTFWRIRTFQSALLIETAEFERAHTLLEASLPVLQRLGTPAETAFCLSMMGLLAYRTGNYQAAKAHGQAAIALYNALDDARGLAFTVNILGHIHGDLGEYAAARQLHEENLARRRAQHDRYGIVYSLNNLGAVAARRQAFAEAQRLYEEAMTLAQTIDFRPGISLGFLNLGALAYWRGDAEAALRLAQQAMRVTEEINDHRNLAWALVNRGNAHVGLGNDADAARDLHEAARLALSLRAVPRTLTALTSIAALRAKTGDLPYAVELATFCLAHPAAAKETQVAAAKLLDELTPQLPAAALRATQAQVKTKTLEEIVAALT